VPCAVCRADPRRWWPFDRALIGPLQRAFDSAPKAWYFFAMFFTTLTAVETGLVFPLLLFVLGRDASASEVCTGSWPVGTHCFASPTCLFRSR
jgi:hypothetical protein